MLNACHTAMSRPHWQRPSPSNESHFPFAGSWWCQPWPQIGQAKGLSSGPRQRPAAMQESHMSGGLPGTAQHVGSGALTVRPDSP